MKRTLLTLLFLAFLIGSVALADEKWICSTCGNENSGTFCGNCGKAKTEDNPFSIVITEKWFCLNCGNIESNHNNFCTDCGQKRSEPVGSIVQLGNFHGIIDWIVLKVEDDKALLISKYGLEKEPYNTEEISVTWETCTLREWLNGTFFNSSFTKQEQNAIMLANIDNSELQGNQGRGWKKAGGNDTKDHIFLLSFRESQKIFLTDEARKCAPTNYANRRILFNAWSDKTKENKPSLEYWLRSPGFGSYGDAAQVGIFGEVDRDGVQYKALVRPAMWIDWKLAVQNATVKTDQ